VPLDDCHAAWSHLQDKAGQWGVDPRRVVVGGQSAGGGLGAALVQQLRDEDDVRPIGQWLWCPMLDDRTAARRELDQPSHWVWDNQRNHFGWRSYLAAEPGAATFPPYAVPARRDDLAGLPPAWIGVGDIDLFHDEDQVYAARLTEAGVPVTFTVVPDAPHGFEVWGSETVISRTHIGTALDWLRATISD
jgi:acetyl esterase/lipase